MADVTIYGAGVFGLSIAWECLRRGARVQVIDPNGPGAGASGGIVGALAPHVPENWNDKKAFQLESLLATGPFCREIGEFTGLPTGYSAAGRVQPLLDDRAAELARARSEGAAALWPADRIWEVTDAPGPWAPPSPSGLWVRDTLSAHLHPRQTCLVLARAVQLSGGQVIGTGASRGAVIDATGAAGLRALTRRWGRLVGDGVKGQAALLAHDASGQPQLFADGLHVVPHLDGTVAIGSTSEREFEDARSTDARLDALIARARALVPALAEARVIERWANERPRAVTRAPLLGPDPRRPGHFIANGGFKIGFGVTVRAARAMADLVLHGTDAGIPPSFHTSHVLDAPR